MMTYDLTPLLTTIASSSASFAAILGGFIASKLISISGEREAVLTRLHEVEQQQHFKENEQAKLKKKLTEQAALDFIKANIQSLIECKPAQDVYKDDIQQELSLEELIPYWQRAEIILEELANTSASDNEAFNQDDLPSSFAIKYHDDDFAYSIGQKVMKWYAQQERKKQPFGNIADFDFDISAADTFQSRMDNKRINELDSDLKWLELQRYQLVSEKNKLVQPKGMRAGLLVFGLFSLCCIVLPMLLIPLTIDSLLVFRRIKALVLLLFTVGLISVFGFLVYLLKWRAGSNNEHK